jgi:hypothetical protein
MRRDYVFACMIESFPDDLISSFRDMVPWFWCMAASGMDTIVSFSNGRQRGQLSGPPRSRLTVNAMNAQLLI